MTQTGDAGPGSAHEHGAADGRAAALSAAILRINASLDLDAVLGEVVESARALTGARYGDIATVDEAGVPHKGIMFSGFTAEEQGALLAWPGSVARERGPVRASPGPAWAAARRHPKPSRRQGGHPAPLRSAAWPAWPRYPLGTNLTTGPIDRG